MISGRAATRVAPNRNDRFEVEDRPVDAGPLPSLHR
jgi:hypothetical protein